MSDGEDHPAAAGQTFLVSDGRDLAIKLYEELFYAQENLSSTPHKIHLAQSMESNWTVLRQRLADLEKASERYDEPAILEHLGVLVPELLAKDNGDGDGKVIEFKRA